MNNIQNNFNNAMTNTAMIVALANINKSIQQLGFNNINELDNAISKLEIEIACAKDENKPYLNKLQLLNKYKAIKKEYEDKVKEEEEKRKKNNAIAISIGLVIGFIGIIIMAVFLSNM